MQWESIDNSHECCHIFGVCVTQSQYVVCRGVRKCQECRDLQRIFFFLSISGRYICELKCIQ